jgi:hypothetical protein
VPIMDAMIVHRNAARSIIVPPFRPDTIGQ